MQSLAARHRLNSQWRAVMRSKRQGSGYTHLKGKGNALLAAVLHELKLSIWRHKADHLLLVKATQVDALVEGHILRRITILDTPAGCSSWEAWLGAGFNDARGKAFALFLASLRRSIRTLAQASPNACSLMQRWHCLDEWHMES